MQTWSSKPPSPTERHLETCRRGGRTKSNGSMWQGQKVSKDNLIRRARQ